MYNVIFLHKNWKETGSLIPVVSWVRYESKENFDRAFDRDMRRYFEVVEEGISREEALKSLNKVRRQLSDGDLLKLKDLLNIESLWNLSNPHVFLSPTEKSTVYELTENAAEGERDCICCVEEKITSPAKEVYDLQICHQHIRIRVNPIVTNF